MSELNQPSSAGNSFEVPCNLSGDPNPACEALDEAFKEATAQAMAQEIRLAQKAYDRRVAVAAYYKAQRRGFQPGHEIEDWFAAEAELAHTQSSPLVR
jgi:Protein of unknown function (DUF2934)